MQRRGVKSAPSAVGLFPVPVVVSNLVVVPCNHKLCIILQVFKASIDVLARRMSSEHLRKFSDIFG